MSWELILAPTPCCFITLESLMLDFGDSCYITRDRLDGDTVVVLAIRHQKEAGF